MKNAPGTSPGISSQKAPRYEQIASQIIEQIERGVYQVGDAIPSVRGGRKLFGVSPGTLLEAYRSLEDRGYIRARPQSGYYVRRRVSLKLDAPRIAAAPARPGTARVDLAIEMLKQMATPGVLQMGAAVPDSTFLPVRAINLRLARAMRFHAGLMHRYGPVTGLPRLRQRLAHFMAQSGCAIGAENLIVTNGCTEAFNLCLRAVTQPGDVVAIESPAYYGLLIALTNLGLKALPIRTCAIHGMDIESLEAARQKHRIKAVALCPSFANPTGACMPLEKRQALVRWAVRHKTPIIEDDTYGELYFSQTRPTPLAAMAHDGLVLYCSSISKTLSPGLRIGWCAPGRYQQRVEELKAAVNPTSPFVQQQALADFLESGGVHKHLRRIRRMHQHQIDRFCEALGRHWKTDFRLHPPAGGHLLWVELPRHLDASRLFHLALQRRISIAPGVIFSPTGRLTHYLRLNCALAWNPALEQAICTLGELIESLEEQG